MSATFSNTNIRLIASNLELGKKFPKEVIPYLLKATLEADAKLKNEIENKIVSIGESAVPMLVEAIKSEQGTARGVAIMSLIRIGSASVECIKEASVGWLGDYIINEIKGSGVPVGINKQMATSVG